MNDKDFDKLTEKGIHTFVTAILDYANSNSKTDEDCFSMLLNMNVNIFCNIIKFSFGTKRPTREEVERRVLKSMKQISDWVAHFDNASSCLKNNAGSVNLKEHIDTLMKDAE